MEAIGGVHDQVRIDRGLKNPLGHHTIRSGEVRDKVSKSLRTVETLNCVRGNISIKFAEVCEQVSKALKPTRILLPPPLEVQRSPSIAIIH